MFGPVNLLKALLLGKIKTVSGETFLTSADRAILQSIASTPASFSPAAALARGLALDLVGAGPAETGVGGVCTVAGSGV